MIANKPVFFPYRALARELSRLTRTSVRRVRHLGGALSLLAVAATLHGFLSTPSWSAESPSAGEIAQVREIIASGVTVTPEMIAMAKARFPELRKFSDDEIQKMISDERSKPGSVVSGVMGADVSGGGASSAVTAVKAARLVNNIKSNTGSHFPSDLKRFGEEFFLNADAIDANAPTGALPEYILSAGDQLQVSTWGRENRSETVVIDNEGMFHYPPLTPMRLAGMRFDAAQKLVVGEIQKIHGISAALSLGQLRSIRIMVLGEAIRPGSFVVPAGSTVSSALFRSGGVTEIGTMRAIEVRRGGKVVAQLDLYDMLLKGKSLGDIQLLSGDVIFVPLTRPQVAIRGAVKRPAIYEVKDGTKALDVVELAGGLLSDAFKGRLLLDRIQGNKRKISLDIDMEKPEAKSNVRIEDGDVMLVDRVLDNTEETVWLRGNVNRAGRYQYKKGMTVKDLIPSLTDLMPETFFEYAQIQRVVPEDGRRELMNFPLGDVFSKGLRVPLEPGDTVMVYSRYDLVSRPTVALSGAVRSGGGGTYTYSEGMRISDLIVYGGGVTEGAYLPEAHLARRVKDILADSSYTKVVKVDLKTALEDPASEQNLLLEPYDVLIVFARENFIPRRTVNVYGAVNSPGQFELAEGLGIPELVKLAGGMSKRGYKLGVEVARRTVVGDSVMTRNVTKLNLKDILEGKQTFALEDGDIVYVREVTNSRAFSMVSLGGEFKFPGQYEFTSGERLSSLIRRAGGFTPEAYLRGAIFLRKRVREQQLRHADEVSRRVQSQMQARLQQATQEKEQAALNLAIQRSGSLLDQIKNAPYLGRVVISIDKKLKFAGTEWDIEMEDGDSLWVGPRVGTVSVVGEVSSPTTLIYTRNTNQVGELLAKAGGVTLYGDYKETFYVGPDGTVTTPRTVPWYSSFKCMGVEPGGTVIVPMKPPAKDYLEVWAQSSEILYHLAVSVGVAVALF